jgi:hypothetical protein
MAKALSLYLRVRALAFVKTGASHREAAERFGVSGASLSRWGHWSGRETHGRSHLAGTAGPAGSRRRDDPCPGKGKPRQLDRAHILSVPNCILKKLHAPRTI